MQSSSYFNLMGYPEGHWYGMTLLSHVIVY